MARCMIFASGLPLNFGANKLQSGTSVSHEDADESGVGGETKGYRVYLPKDKVVVTTQHVKNIETLDKQQNEHVQRLYLQEETAEAEEPSSGGHQEPAGEAATDRAKAPSKRKKTKKSWTRERHVTRSVGRKTREDADESAEEQQGDVVNNVVEVEPRNYREAMHSRYKRDWQAAMGEELRALEQNDVWNVVRRPRGVHVLHTKWVFKTKRDADGGVERLKARLVICGNEQQFGVDYSVTFSAVIDMCSVKLVFALARKWRVPAKHGHVPNTYVKADKEAEMDIYAHLPHGMKIPEKARKKLGVTRDNDLVLELRKELYGLKRRGATLLVVGVYVDDLLVTGTDPSAVGAFFSELSALVVKDLGPASTSLGMRVVYDEECGYDLDQEAAIVEMLRDHGMEFAHGVRTPIGAEWSELQGAEDEVLPLTGGGSAVTVRKFQSLVGSLMWFARCTRPDVAFTVHKASRRTYSPTLADWRLGETHRTVSSRN
ncbi:Copia protein [Phytophthora megakarya]|uniref:Copia protein n=1 Tax=Phytophthora megakarya TaxID=4795 RepID=A0A225VD75_9STRA|nr:Copia protein [Phytophthora megakarya]